MEKTIKKYNIGHRYSEPPYECDINYTEDGDFLQFHSRRNAEKVGGDYKHAKEINQFQTTDLNYLRFILQVLEDQCKDWRIQLRPEEALQVILEEIGDSGTPYYTGKEFAMPCSNLKSIAEETWGPK